MRELELAWAAGLFDGEGSTSVLKTQRDRYTYLRMSVSQKDRRVLDRFTKAVGVGKVYFNKRGMHSWDCFRQDQVYNVLDLLWPYLSDAKKEQATAAKSRVVSAKSNFERK